MPDPRWDAVLDHVSVLNAHRLRDTWTILYLELLAQELLCTPPSAHDRVAYEMLYVIRGDAASPSE